MAHGYWLATGRPQAVMVHVNVGLANTLMGVINAARDNVPLLLLSGRTPVGEGGRTGARDLPIHWGQEMRDQGAMVRELVKWDYELRLPEQVPELIDRALAIATSPPMGPVYLSLPREVLCSPMDGVAARAAAAAAGRCGGAGGGGDRGGGRADRRGRAAAADRPSAPAPSPAFAALERFAARLALPVVEFWPSRISLPVDHPMHAGFDPGAALAEADLVLVVDALIPWIPQRHPLPAGCRVIQLGPDPAVRRHAGARLPVRPGARGRRRRDPGPARRGAGGAPAGDRFERAWRAPARRHVADRASGLAAADAGAAAHVAGLRQPPSWPSAARGRDPVLRARLRSVGDGLSRPGSYFGFPPSGGLGWGLPAALGAQLAHPDRTVVATVGDGSYLFANPVACHQVAEALDLPILTVVLNNGCGTPSTRPPAWSTPTATPPAPTRCR